MQSQAQSSASTKAACSQEACGEGGGCGGGSGGDLPPAAQAPPPGTVCLKCRKAEAEVVARGREPLCHPCLHEQLLSKVRGAVRLHSLILPGDHVALAFSGGRASAALLHFLAQLRNPRADRAARGQVHFTLHVLHVDDSAALGLGPEQAAARSAAVAAAAAPYCHEAGVQFHAVPLEAVFDEEGGDSPAAAPTSAAGAAVGAAAAAATAVSLQQEPQPQPAAEPRARLAALLAAVPDATGRRDLARHLRARGLLRTAAALGCRRLARGDCATALATHIVAAASKGCGYSLPGDVRLLDERHGSRLPAVFLPLREVSARELAVVCSHWRLPLADAEGTAGSGGGGSGGLSAADKKDINALAAAFIAGMEAHNPGSVPNIVNSISKLEAFPWNEPQPQPAAGAPQQRRQQGGAAAGGGGVGDQQQQHPMQQEQQEQQQQAQQRYHSAVLCPICLAPLADDELPGTASSSSSAADDHGHTRGGSGMAAAAQAAGCCLSCCAQILGGGSGQGARVAAALPAALQQQMAALAKAGAEVAGPAAAADGGAGGIDRLRAQIAEFLLDDEEC